eukprot:676030-Prorocentrum_minimum.AAC.1
MGSGGGIRVGSYTDLDRGSGDGIRGWDPGVRSGGEIRGWVPGVGSKPPEVGSWDGNEFHPRGRIRWKSESGGIW